MTDRSRLAVGQHVGYLPTAADGPAVAGESWAAQIIASDRNGFTVLARRPDGEPVLRQGLGTERIVASGPHVPGTAREASDLYRYDETLHFAERRLISGVTLGTPGTLGAPSSSFWGTINVYKSMRLVFGHAHIGEDGSGGSHDGEVFRRRGFSGPWTLIMTVSLAGGGGDFGTGFGVIVGDPELLRGDYLAMQMTGVQTGSPFGYMIDLHMAVR